MKPPGPPQIALHMRKVSRQRLHHRGGTRGAALAFAYCFEQIWNRFDSSAAPVPAVVKKDPPPIDPISRNRETAKYSHVRVALQTAAPCDDIIPPVYYNIIYIGTRRKERAVGDYTVTAAPAAAAAAAAAGRTNRTAAAAHIKENLDLPLTPRTRRLIEDPPGLHNTPPPRWTHAVRLITRAQYTTDTRKPRKTHQTRLCVYMVYNIIIII